jgi:hypothetical protein
VSYPLTVVKSQTAPSQNSIYDGYENAAKVLGNTHGLRVITTETLTSYPKAIVATANEITEKTPALTFTSGTPVVSYYPTSTAQTPTTATTRATTTTAPTTTTTTPTPPETTQAYRQPPTSSPAAPTYFLSSSPNYYESNSPNYYESNSSPNYGQEPNNNNYFIPSTPQAEEETVSERQPYFFSRSPPTVPAVTATPIVRNTGRTVARVQLPSTTPPPPPAPPTQQPRVVVSPYSQDRQPLFRHSNRVVTTNDLENPSSYVQEVQEGQYEDEEQEQPVVVITRPTTTTERTTTTTVTPPPTTTTTTTTTRPRPRQRPTRPAQQTGRAVGHVRQRQRVKPQEQQQHQQQPPQQSLYQQEQFPPQQQQQQQRPRGQVLGQYYYNNLMPGLLHMNTNGAYQSSYYNGLDQQKYQQVGLEEIEPQIIEFNIPHKMIPIRAQNEREKSPQGILL